MSPSRPEKAFLRQLAVCSCANFVTCFKVWKGPYQQCEFGLFEV